MYIYIQILYIYREREEREMYVYIYIYVYDYIDLHQAAEEEGHAEDEQQIGEHGAQQRGLIKNLIRPY